MARACRGLAALVLAPPSPRQGWPSGDVDGACAHGYSCVGVDER
jgi:hypothetical protein